MFRYRFLIPNHGFTAIVSSIAALLLSQAVLQADDEPAEPMPPELKSLRTNYDQAVKRSLSPIQARYLKHLNQLLDKYTRQKDLDSALVVRDEIQRIEALMNGTEISKEEPEPDPHAEFLAWLNDRELYWEGTRADELVITFDDYELKVFADDRELMEKEFVILSPKVFQFDWGNGDLNTFTLADDKDTFTRHMKSSSSTHLVEIRRR